MISGLVVFGIYCVLNLPIEYLYVENLLNWKVSCARNIPQQRGSPKFALGYCVPLS